ncbi:DNA-binding transcriptional regulator, MarR family [Roseivivax halotolerans]|jgi:DNA-binding MarR family transcriptional regulator|uniref:DNA-binding transcriptional regulator, MarR family n=1 Tax=Roseivivax halotolerans TaxID=93684 RepID=A0A1I5YXY5_9RHOB|nr:MULTISPECIES: MarR family transcriptional regulator [Roseivivax]QFT61396.1 Organic hydroperoxide resistance transcriptional regulator [Roseivivax sp. THAF30]SFQ49096.1 DNA-binding transcriptional regulator, MarR family [Roseivivax halotolerans]
MTDTLPETGLEALLCFDLYAAQNAMGRFYKSLLEPLGLTYPQYLVMTTLWAGEPLSVGQIGQRLGLETNTVTPLLKRLEDAGRIRRDRDAADDRRVLLYLTPEGRALRAKAAHVPACITEALGMSQREIGELQNGLRQLRSALLPKTE